MALQMVIMAILGGPIKYWWDDNWETPLHWHYDAWREALNAGLVADGSFLIYRPHHAFKGTWTERGQVVNDAAISASDVFVDMSPLGVPSEGTDSEKLQASSRGAIVVPAPPPAMPEEFPQAIACVIQHIKQLNVHHTMVEQRPVLDCMGWQPRRHLAFNGMFREYAENTIRLHYVGANHRLAVEDVLHPRIRRNSQWLTAVQTTSQLRVPLEGLLKAEVLDLAA